MYVIINIKEKCKNILHFIKEVLYIIYIIYKGENMTKDDLKNSELMNNTLDILNTILDTTNEWLVVVDNAGYISMMSKGYKEFLKVTDVIGKHVTEVIENTRLDEVLKTGKMEVAEIQEIRDNRVIAMRIPMIKDGEIIGAIGKVMFKDIEDFHALSKKLSKLEKEISYYESELNENLIATYSIDDIIGVSKGIIEAKKITQRAAKTNSTILITGESGTGKEVFANAIHNLSSRRLAKFVKINCAAIPSELLESELFGYDDGAFTGARKGGKTGKFQLANGGSILLDEIGDMSLHMQAKLLRVIQEKEVEKVGSLTSESIDVRIIASTNRDLEEMVKSGDFREDLYYRLNVIRLELPPLRDRHEDIEALSSIIRKKIAERLGVYVEGISKRSIKYLSNYDFPGNIRELENIIERSINMLDSDLIIEPEHLPSRITKEFVKKRYTSGTDMKSAIEEIEKDMIIATLKKTNNNKNETAKLLGISRPSLYKKIGVYGVDIDK